MRAIRECGQVAAAADRAQARSYKEITGIRPNIFMTIKAMDIPIMTGLSFLPFMAMHARRDAVIRGSQGSTQSFLLSSADH
ncbi:MAG: hypothetical protein GAK28_02723 [Luteibacter sp.]|uniref:hypothetical protein n=1 Tax=Luteibacter sp. TaxID=1886636 RepID=UPI001382A2A9|nr:hypothetical protein [Luteibacter sp.]KAF1006105.1 MAG: hypothetical protein GAK28_02723 [Luteibacter sp.]